MELEFCRYMKKIGEEICRKRRRLVKKVMWNVVIEFYWKKWFQSITDLLASRSATGTRSSKDLSSTPFYLFHLTFRATAASVCLLSINVCFQICLTTGVCAFVICVYSDSSWYKAKYRKNLLVFFCEFLNFFIS